MADKNFLTDIIDADLAEGKIREIHTRFPPEPNGYLHIGSAKAIYINWSIANQYGGKFNLRLDDTNPAREGEEYVNSIIEDLHLRETKFCPTAAYGHFGRNDLDLPWERLDKAEDLKKYL